MNWDQKLALGVEHIARVDHRLRPFIQAYGTPAFRPHSEYYQELVESIISQQLSVKAAATINGRFVEVFGHFPSPHEILEQDYDTLRRAGLSGPKTNYIRDLAGHIVDGRVRFSHLDNQTNDEIIAELTDVKGIGEWTVHMFLIFCMGRLDVLAYGDLGVRSGIKSIYGLDNLPDKTEVIEIAEKNLWAPYQSVACWYIWRSLENKPNDD